jgi:hypothetical protein
MAQPAAGRRCPDARSVFTEAILGVGSIRQVGGIRQRRNRTKRRQGRRISPARGDVPTMEGGAVVGGGLSEAPVHKRGMRGGDVIIKWRWTRLGVAAHRDEAAAVVWRWCGRAPVDERHQQRLRDLLRSPVDLLGLLTTKDERVRASNGSRLGKKKQRKQ